MRRRGPLLAAVLAGAALVGCTQAASPVSAAPPRAWAPAVAPASVDPATAYVEARLADMTTLQLAESVIMIRIPSTDPDAARAAVAASGIAGVILMGADTRYSPEVAHALTSALVTDPGLPPLTAVDQEGGTVARLDDPGPSAPALGRMPPEATRQAFADRARLVASGGFTLNFGIVADVTSDPRSFIAPRVFGGDPAAVSARVAEAVAGEHGIVLSTLKHFPGHGAVAGDSHQLIPETAMSLDDWRASEAPPFEAGIAAGAELVMMGHLRFTAVDAAPASLSPAWYRILREELGFDGVIVTDSLSMLQSSGEPALADPDANGLAALTAGADLLLYAGPLDTAALAARITAAVDDGSLPRERLEDAARRVLELRRGLATSDAPYARCRAACAVAAS
ncbi:MAG: glycosyl hydrolase family 3 [Leifsonia xyli]|nr:MAG: glycosyl hydrolase family 3 [Leifsonia xyli]